MLNKPSQRTPGQHLLYAALYGSLAGLLYVFTKDLRLETDRDMVELVRNVALILMVVIFAGCMVRVVVTMRTSRAVRRALPWRLWMAQTAEASAKVVAFVCLYGFARGWLDMEKALFQGASWMGMLQGYVNFATVILVTVLVVVFSIYTTFSKPKNHMLASPDSADTEK